MRCRLYVTGMAALLLSVSPVTAVSITSSSPSATPAPLDFFVGAGDSYGGAPATEIVLKGTKSTTVTGETTFTDKVPAAFSLVNDGGGATRAIVNGVSLNPFRNLDPAPNPELLFSIFAGAPATVSVGLTVNGTNLGTFSVTGPNAQTTYKVTDFGELSGLDIRGSLTITKNSLTAPANDTGFRVQVVPGTAGSTPEPGSVLLVCGVGMLLAHRRRRVA